MCCCTLIWADRRPAFSHKLQDQAKSYKLRISVATPHNCTDCSWVYCHGNPVLPMRHASHCHQSCAQQALHSFHPARKFTPAAYDVAGAHFWRSFNVHCKRGAHNCTSGVAQACLHAFLCMSEWLGSVNRNNLYLFMHTQAAYLHLVHAHSCFLIICPPHGSSCMDW